jgi:hypothetical protein
MSTSLMTYSDDTFTYNPDTYVDAGVTTLPQPGTYRLRVTSLSRRKDRETNAEVLQEGWPILVLNRIEIVEPHEEAGTFALFEDLRTKPYYRRKGDPTTAAARHMDLLRAIDQEMRPENFKEGLLEVETLLASGHTFVAQLGYRVTDKAWAMETIAAAGGKEAMDKDTYNKVWNSATLTTKDFKNPNGGYRQMAMGRSGAMLDAKLSISKFIPSGQAESLALGPFTR